MVLLLAWLACAADPEPASAPSTEPAPEPAPRAAPRVRIEGQPILDRPVVLGGIGTEAVEAGLAPLRDGIGRCYADASTVEKGKVLVKFTIARDGSVADATTLATSLRVPRVEDYVVALVRSATFTPLQSGSTAIVKYPFAFP